MIFEKWNYVRIYVRHPNTIKGPQVDKDIT
jgi:hypothetical protein